MSPTPRATGFFTRLFLNYSSRTTRTAKEAVQVGADYMGNTYYEQYGVGPHLRILDGKVLPKRWFFPSDPDARYDFDAIPPEWQAWLRYRRFDQPTEEEINLNLAVAHVKKINAKKLEEQYRLESGHKEKEVVLQEDVQWPERNINPQTGEAIRPSFPKYEEYEKTAQYETRYYTDDYVKRKPDLSDD